MAKPSQKKILPKIDIGKLTADLTRQEVEIDSTTFYIAKLTPMEAYHLLDEIRSVAGEQVMEALSSMIGKEDAGIDAIFAAVLSADHDKVDYVRQRLFAPITFKRTPNVSVAQDLLGAEDMAFEGMDAGRVFEVMLRAFAVNFTSTLLRFQQPSQKETQATKSSSAKARLPSSRTR